MQATELSGELAAGIAALGLEVAAADQARLLAYLDLLQKWNKTYNLTAIRDPRQMLTHHLLDSLAALPALDAWLTKSALVVRRPLRVVDVGSGAGLPGLVWAIVRPEWSLVSVDAVDKKAAFQRQVCIELGMRQVKVVSGRVEGLPAASADLVVSRAFADLADFVRLAGHLPESGGALLAMKGVMPEAEIAALPAGWQVAETAVLAVPGLEAQRHLIVLERT